MFLMTAPIPQSNAMPLQQGAIERQTAAVSGLIKMRLMKKVFLQFPIKVDQDLLFEREEKMLRFLVLDLYKLES